MIKFANVCVTGGSRSRDKPVRPFQLGGEPGNPDAQVVSANCRTYFKKIQDHEPMSLRSGNVPSCRKVVVLKRSA